MEITLEINKHADGTGFFKQEWTNLGRDIGFMFS